MIRGVTREQVRTDRESRMANGQDGPLATPPGRKPMILRPQILMLRPGYSVRGVRQGTTQPWAAVCPH